MVSTPDLTDLPLVKSLGLLDKGQIKSKDRRCLRCRNHISAEKVALAALRVKYLVLTDLKSAGAYEELESLAGLLLCRCHEDGADNIVESWVTEYTIGKCDVWTTEQISQRKRCGLQALLVFVEDKVADSDAKEVTYGPRKAVGHEPDHRLSANAPTTPSKLGKRPDSASTDSLREPIKTPEPQSRSSISGTSWIDESPQSSSSLVWTDRSLRSQTSTPGTSPRSHHFSRYGLMEAGSIESPTARLGSKSRTRGYGRDTAKDRQSSTALTQEDTFENQRQKEFFSNSSRQLFPSFSVAPRITRSVAKELFGVHIHEESVSEEFVFEECSKPPKTRTQISKLVYECLQRPVTPGDCKGYIYMYYREGSQAFIKIGRSEEQPTRRIEEQGKACKHHAIRIEDDNILVHSHKRLELLIRKELHSYRRREHCKGCSGRHQEWFETTIDIDGQLKESWRKHLSTTENRTNVSYQFGIDWQNWIDSFPIPSIIITQPNVEPPKSTKLSLVFKARRHFISGRDTATQNFEGTDQTSEYKESLIVPTRGARSKSLTRLTPSDNRVFAETLQAEQVSRALALADPLIKRGRRLADIKPKDVQNMLAQPASTQVVPAFPEPEAPNSKAENPIAANAKEEHSEGSKSEASKHKTPEPRIPLDPNLNEQNQNLVLRTTNPNITDISAEHIKDIVKDTLKQPKPSSASIPKEPLATGGIDSVIKPMKTIKKSAIKAADG
ncbi:MAG: hypothetical protein M1812_004379 [Candelaria pacifica]|nr:MAG: hypothetical protein M1812_004379 [Candelaria pacifica]